MESCISVVAVMSETEDSDAGSRHSPRDPSRDVDRHTSADIKFHVALAAFIRLTLVLYGVFHDQVFDLKYTDVDYTVFTDGARFVLQGRSPFLRDGYRYTPLVAFLMLPNLFVPIFGKVLFLTFDLMTGYLVHVILIRMKGTVHPSLALLSSLTWLYNPLPIIVSTRGSSDSIQTFLVVALFACLMRDSLITAGLLFGLAVHVKLYPVIYGPAIFLFLAKELPNGSLLSYQLWNPLTRKRVKFFVAAVFSFCATTFACWHFYERRYLDESWLFHLRRKDLQHNFSVYFYAYRLIPAEYHSTLSSMAFVPQLVSVTWFSLRNMTSESRSREQMSAKFLASAFQSTFIFVSLNKVITSQYFLWYLCLLPFVLPFVPQMWSVSRADDSPVPRHTGTAGAEQWYSKRFLMTSVMWIAGQVLWLLPAYLFQFRRWHNSLIFVWIASILFLFVNLVSIGMLSPPLRPGRKKSL